MSDQKEVRKEETKVAEKEPCTHTHPGVGTAWQFAGLKQSVVWTESGEVAVGVVTWICPYCNGTKQVVIG